MPTTDHGPRMPALLALRVVAWRARHALGIVLVVALTAWVVHPLLPAPEDTVPVVVTARPVAAGAELTAADLRVVHLPGPPPDGTVSTPDQRDGRTTLVDLPAGMPLVDTLLTGARFDIEPPTGTVVVPVHLSDDGLAQMVRPGDLIDVVTTATDETGADRVEVLAQRALVVDVRTGSDEGLGSALRPDADEPSRTVTVAVSPAEGRRLAASTGWSELGGVLVQ